MAFPINVGREIAFSLSSDILFLISLIFNTNLWTYTEICLFESKNTLQYYKVTRRCSPLHLMLASPLTCTPLICT